MIVLRFFALAILLPLQAMAQETVVTGLSKDNISLNATFDGSELFVFGAIRREAPIPEDAGDLDIVITVKGPTGTVVVRRKSWRFGIWVNTAAVKVREAPSFYAIASTRPLPRILSETESLRYGIGMAQAVRKVASHPDIPDTQPFADAVVRLRSKEHLYTQLDGAVSVAEETLFQVALELPANLVEGRYLAEFFLVRNMEVVHKGETEIVVEKTGMQRWLYNLSQQDPLIYGLLSVALALIAGWMAAAAFRLARH